VSQSQEILVHRRQETPAGGLIVPLAVSRMGEKAAHRFIEFFTANIRNRNTRRAYGRAVNEFLTWCEAQRLHDLISVQPIHVAAYVELLQKTKSRPTAKQNLAAIRMLFDWLVVGQVVPVNPATSVRGPKHVVKRGKTPVLPAGEVRRILDRIDTSHVVGLRDRALIGLLVYTFGRVGAAVTMRVEDYYPQGEKRWWVRLHEKGGKRHEMPAHHNLEAYLDEYIRAAGIGNDKKGPLFRTAAGKTRTLTDRAMSQADVFRMIKRRAKEARIATPINCHTFRATGITTYLQNGGTLENAQAMAAHASPRTTALYDRRGDEISLLLFGKNPIGD